AGPGAGGGTAGSPPLGLCQMLTAGQAADGPCGGAEVGLSAVGAGPVVGGAGVASERGVGGAQPSGTHSGVQPRPGAADTGAPETGAGAGAPDSMARGAGAAGSIAG